MTMKTRPINFRANDDRIRLLHEARMFFYPDGTLADLINAAIDEKIKPVTDDLERIRKFVQDIPPTKKAGKRKASKPKTPAKARSFPMRHKKKA